MIISQCCSLLSGRPGRRPTRPSLILRLGLRPAGVASCAPASVTCFPGVADVVDELSRAHCRPSPVPDRGPAACARSARLPLSVAGESSNRSESEPQAWCVGVTTAPLRYSGPLALLHGDHRGTRRSALSSVRSLSGICGEDRRVRGCLGRWQPPLSRRLADRSAHLCHVISARASDQLFGDRA